ncbi:hypothetical protein ECTPHS_12505 [Ectothiorhodospira sp. PHS-1]|nr:hypothetical protein ECTPHS_12505 [Ectothiorhodospira sp. PHS-1]
MEQWICFEARAEIGKDHGGNPAQVMDYGKKLSTLRAPHQLCDGKGLVR